MMRDIKKALENEEQEKVDNLNVARKRSHIPLILIKIGSSCKSVGNLMS